MTGSMKPRLVWLEPSRDPTPVVVGLGVCAHYITKERARELHRQLGELIDDDAEMPTRKDTPLAIAAVREEVRDTDPAPPRTTSSAGFKAVNVTRHFEDAKKGTPPDSQGKP